MCTFINYTIVYANMAAITKFIAKNHKTTACNVTLAWRMQNYAIICGE